MRYVILAVATAAAMAAGGPMAAAAGDNLEAALKERYPVSRIEVQNPGTQGTVYRPATVLTLQADGVPAKTLRVIQLNNKSPRFHVHDFARVDVDSAGHVTGPPADRQLARGTRLVVLDVKVERDRVRILTHTLEEIRLADGSSVYGCTEFTFRIPSGKAQAGDSAAIEDLIDRVLPKARG